MSGFKRISGRSVPLQAGKNRIPVRSQGRGGTARGGAPSDAGRCATPGACHAAELRARAAFAVVMVVTLVGLLVGCAP